MPSTSSQIAAALLAAAAAALAPDTPPDVHVAHGRPVWESCARDMLAVWSDQRNARQSAGGRGGRGTMTQIVPQWRVDIVRCVPGLKEGGRPPSPAELEASAVQLLDDIDRIEQAVLAGADSIFGTAPSVTYGSATPLGPLGYVAGWSWPIQAGRR